MYIGNAMDVYRYAMDGMYGRMQTAIGFLKMSVLDIWKDQSKNKRRTNV